MAGSGSKDKPFLSGFIAGEGAGLEFGALFYFNQGKQMPYKWVMPELFVSYKGVKVYRTYHGGEPEDRADYWFTTIPTNDDLDGRDEGHFDVRDIFSQVAPIRNLKDPRTVRYDAKNHKNTKAIIRAGIKRGFIK